MQRLTFPGNAQISFTEISREFREYFWRFLEHLLIVGHAFLPEFRSGSALRQGVCL